MATTVSGYATQFITFTRTSNATVTDADGKIKWAGHNLLLASESFDSSSWVRTGLSSVAANSITAPNGTLTADKIVENSSPSTHRVDQTTAAPVTGASYTVTVYCKPAGRNFAMMQIVMGGVNSYAICDLTTATFGTPTNASGSATFNAASIGDGWVRMTGVFTASDTTTEGVKFFTASNATTFNYTGDGSSGVYLWGAHLYRSDLGGMQANTSAYPMYNPTTPKNLLGFSEEFSNAAWTKTGTTVTANAILAPNGLQTADKIVSTAASGYHGVRQGFTYGTGTYTISVYAKAAEYTKLYIADLSVGNGYAAYDLLSGVVISTGGGAKFVSAAIAPADNGFYRCSLVVTNVNTTSSPTFYGYPTGATLDANGASYTGDGISGIYLWGAQLSDSASLDPYVPVYGAAVTSAAYYGPRRDFDPVTLACKGLLVEEQRSNLFLRSDRFDATGSWTAANLTVTADTATAPDGTMTADTLAATAANGVIQQAASVTNAAVYTFSVWIKRKTGSGAVSLSDLNGNYFPVTVDSTWTRCTLTSTAASTTGRGYIRLTTSGDEVYIWGAQLEAGSFATSYIPTGSATATRSADVASVSTQAFPYSSTEGTLVANFSSLTGNATVDQMVVQLDHGTIAQRHKISRYNGGIYGTTTVTTPQADITLAAASSAGVSYKAAYAFKENDFAGTVGGGVVATDTSGSMPSGITEMRLGKSATSVDYLNGHIRQITYLPRRISNSELVIRTQ